MKKILIVGCGKDQIKLIKAAQRLKFIVTGVDKEKKNKKYVDEFINLSTYDYHSIIKYLSKQSNITYDAVVTNASAKSLVTAVKIAKKFKLLNFSETLAQCSLSKIKLYQYCKKNNIPTIETKIFNGKNKKIKNVILKPSLPIIGKAGVYLIKKESEINCIKITSIQKNSLDSKIIVQPFISGEDLGLFIASFKGNPIWHSFYSEKNFFNKGNLKSLGVRKSSRDKNEKYRKLALNIAKEFCKKNYVNGFLSMSFRIDDLNRNILLYEMNPGIPGDKIIENVISKDYPHTDFYSLDILLMCGKKIKL